MLFLQNLIAGPGLLIFGLAFAVSLLLMPVMLWLAERWVLYDEPSHRKVHNVPIPRTGGVAIMLGVVAGMLLVPMDMHTRIGVLGGCIFLGVFGLWDDLMGMRPLVKLSAQFFAELWAVGWGIQIHFVRVPFADLTSIGMLGIPLTIFWIILMINTINLIDGVDGLAAGITFIAGLAILMGGFLINHSQGLLFVLALLGSLLAFLRYNFSPARIFMGDSGSMVCGYLLAAASVLGVFKTTTTFALAMPVLALGLPLADTSLAVVRRLRAGRSIFAPDKQHVHHWLLAKGLTQRQVAMTAYSITALLSALGVALVAHGSLSSF